MIHKNLRAFLEETTHNSVYVFTSDSCELCAQFEKDLSAYDTSSFTSVEVTNDEEAILSEMFKIQGFPFTVVFINNDIGMIKKGILYQKQMNDIFDFLKKNNIKTDHVKVPVTQLSPVILEIPNFDEAQWSHEYFANTVNDCLKHDEAPLNINAMFGGILDAHNPIHASIISKMKETWNFAATKTVVYTDLGITDIMLEGITDAAARGREVEFRKLYED